ncbi:phage SPO1 DNA polymerase-related protein [Burkholderia stagnalis]|nr:phage SPO1 DNA polymerase-related protein [Burkholderia stagnalis]
MPRAPPAMRKPAPIMRKPPNDPHDAPATLDACRRCPLWEHATQAVPGVGPRDARIMLIGEQPGDREDRAGEPFVGAAGHVLDRALEDAGLSRASVYLTNAVKHFKWEPRGKRRLHKTPAQREVDACGYWLDREIDAVRPEVIVALGVTALRAVLHDHDATLRGATATLQTADGYAVVATYHPSYVLRTRGADAREHAYRVLVDALRTAAGLAHADRQRAHAAR